MELHHLHITLYTTWDFRFLSKGDLRVGKQVLSFLDISLRDISFVLNKKPKFRLPFVKAFNIFKMLFILGWFCCDFFLRDYFIHRLINNTGGPLLWVLTDM